MMFDTGLSLHSRKRIHREGFVQNMNFQEETSGDAQSPISQEPEHSSGMEVRKYKWTMFKLKAYFARSLFNRFKILCKLK